MPDAARAASHQRLQIRLLGELQVGACDAPTALPASRKTRALLAYLTVTAKRHLRSELCSLFWEDAADPRAGLRWSLTKIRQVLGARDASLIRADRESVELLADRVETDLRRLADLVGSTRVDCTQMGRDALIEAGALFRGEFLEGLELPACYAYHEWCLAQRETAARRHEQVLVALVESHRDDAEQALRHARALVSHNPLNERGHIELMRALGALGRRREALAQFAQCCQIFERELNLGPPAGLEEARLGLFAQTEGRSDGDGVVNSARDVRDAAGHMRAGFVGRTAELGEFVRSFEIARTATTPEALLVTGVAGIGKTRLLDEFERHVALGHGHTLRGRAYEAERVRPFGYWIDALRALPRGILAPAVDAALRPLTQAGAGQSRASDRDSLFDAVLAALSDLAKSGPVVVLVDDLHWIEASSAALLHYVIRRSTATAVLFAFTGRTGEMEDNASAQNLVAALARAQRLRRIALGPLDEHDARSLVGAVTKARDPGLIVDQAKGNPLILLELARARDTGGVSMGLLGRILELRLSRLSQGAAQLLDWASAFGQAFALEPLIAARGDEAGSVDQQLSELERHELICAVGDSGYEFGHDLIQQAAYSRISQPRRRLMHKAIAQALSLEADAHPETFGEIVHHAALAGQHAVAARASISAGEHGLRVFANREAAEVARRGLRHAAHTPESPARAQLVMSLLRIQVLATSGLQLAWLRPSAGEITSAIELAHALHLHDDVAMGHYLLSVVHQEAGELDAAQQATLRAAKAAYLSDVLGRARQLANSARCLVELGRDVGRARELAAEAEALAQTAGVHEIEMRWCAGLLHQWDGQLDLAAQEIDAAIALATEAEDRWRQCKCLASAALIELERGRPKQATARARDLHAAAFQLGEAVDAPLARAIEALAGQISGDGEAPLDVAIDQLRVADDRSRLACVLNLAASIRFERQDFEQAGALAADALTTAESIGETNEAAVALATGVQVALSQGQADRADAGLEKLRQVLETPHEFSAKAVRAANAAYTRANPGVPVIRGHAAVTGLSE